MPIARRIFLVVAFLCLRSAAWGQQVSFGFIGGVNLTPSFHNTSYVVINGITGDPMVTTVTTGPRSAIFGPTVDVNILRHLSIEVDALHRDLHFGAGDSQAIGTWEFPILAKYKLPLAKTQPFLELGPSFRLRTTSSFVTPSSFGVTIGLGTEFAFKRLRIAPAIRYTRWQEDPSFPNFATNPDQIELVTSFSYAASPKMWNVLGRRFRLGAIAGIAPTSGFEQNVFDQFGSGRSESVRYTAGFMFEAGIASRASLEVDGLYRPLHYDIVGNSTYGPSRDPGTILTWELPILAKYRLTSAGVRPFIEAGPSARFTGNLNGGNPSHIGVTAGLGIEKAVSYTHLGKGIPWLTPGVVFRCRQYIFKERWP